MFVQYSFVQDRRQDVVGEGPVELTPALATVLGIGAMIASTLLFVIA
jgi:hypothetical protein